MAFYRAAWPKDNALRRGRVPSCCTPRFDSHVWDNKEGRHHTSRHLVKTTATRFKQPWRDECTRPHPLPQPAAYLFRKCGSRRISLISILFQSVLSAFTFVMGQGALDETTLLFMTFFFHDGRGTLFVQQPDRNGRARRTATALCAASIGTKSTAQGREG